MNINIYNPYVRREMELYHHGINGQKWGKRYGPPYPLAAGAHSAAERRAGWRNSIYNNGKGTHFSRKVEKYVYKNGGALNTRKASKSLNLLERQRAKDMYEMRKERMKGDKADQDKIKQHQSNIENGNRMANELIKYYNEQGFTIGSAEVIRDAAYGKHMFTNWLGWKTIPLLTVGHTLARRGTNYVEGKRYRVSDKENPNFLKRNDEGRDYKLNRHLKSAATALDTLVVKIPGGYRTSNYRRVTGR